MAFAVNNAAVTDTVYISSYTYDAAGQDIISGLSGANGVGMNGVAALKGAGNPNNYIFVDADQATLDTTADANNIGVPENPVSANESHNKLIVIPGKYVITGSGNYTASAMSAQPNDFLQIRVPAVTARFVTQMEEFRAGTFHDNTASGGSMVFYSPQNDTIEVYFSPDENGTLATGDADGLGDDGTGHLPVHPATGTVEGAVMNHIWKARESLFYSVAGFTLSDEFDSANLESHMYALTNAGKLVEGAWETLDNSPVNGMRDRLQADHESRDGNTPFASPFHNKFMVIDQEVVITGSGNFTASAMAFTNGNDENKVVLSDFRLARKYLWYYRNLLSTQVTTADGVGANTFEVTRPAGVTGFTVTATDTAFYPSWTADPTNDVSRYFIFIDTALIDTKAIGDGVDEDADGNVDEDPRGNADNFSSGTTEGGATANDDDADGANDEDLWMWPEIQVKGRSSTGGNITSWNVGDSLVAGVSYWFAIVSVDTHGNEAVIDTAGPFTLTGSSDTSIRVSKNSDTGSRNVFRNDTNIVVSSIWVRGDTTTSGDTISVFAVRNNGNADTGDVIVKLWRDENRDSKVSAGDSLVATLTRYTAATKQFDTTVLADSRSYLGSGATAGRNYLVTIEILPAATYGDTFQMLIAAQTCDAARADTGPDAQVLNAGIFTIVSANQVAVAKRGDTPSESIAVNDTRVVMTLRVSVTTPNDTLTAVGIRNLGTMVSGDVARLAIYEDAGADSVLTTADTFIKNLTVNGSIWRDTTISRSFTGTSINLLVVLVTSSGATGLRTFQAEVPIREVDTLNGDSGPTALVTTTAVFTVPSDTGPDTAVRLNEFIPDPNGQNWDNDGSTIDIDEEFVELYNNSDLNVDISGWKYDADFSVGNNVVLPTLSPLRAREFCLIRRDTSGVNNVLIYDSTGISIRDSGIWTGTAADLANTNDTCVISNASNTIIDSYFYPVGGFVAGRSNSREFDGADTWRTGARITPGKNSDPTANMNNASPNAKFTVIATPTTVSEGVNFTIAVTAKNSDDSTIATFYRTAVLRSDSGTIAPSITGSFASGIRSESISISNVSASGSRVVTVAYNSTTSGTVAVQINNLATVTATINLEARADESSCTGTLSNGVDTYIAVSNASGTIVFSAVASGTYQLATKENHHLKRVVTGIVIAGTDSTVTVGLHRAGDANDDNRINIFDGAIVKFFKIFGTGVTADIDGNAAVNDADLAWVRNNFGRVGE